MFNVERYMCPLSIGPAYVTWKARGLGRCPECDNYTLDAEFENNGVGYQQVGPTECTHCGAAQDWDGNWYTAEDIQDKIDNMEKAENVK